MRKYFFLCIVSFLMLSQAGYAQEETEGAKASLGPRVLLLISEQNIEGPQQYWWAGSEIDLSTIESKLAQTLIAYGYQVLEPFQLTGVLRKEKAFTHIDISESESIELAKLSKADYVLLGKALASSGGKVADSNMHSCHASVTVKLINIKEGRAIAYLDASGSSIHLDSIVGGREALTKAGEQLAVKIIDALKGGADEYEKS
ncbi:MAG: hypothetical protein ISS44_02075 [Candidatus Omnitrophica bacterium]|nr:hypothetical protein [Candidatus Omnitrophota bacterium]